MRCTYCMMLPAIMYSALLLSRSQLFFFHTKHIASANLCSHHPSSSQMHHYNSYRILCSRKILATKGLEHGNAAKFSRFPIACQKLRCYCHTFRHNNYSALISLIMLRIFSVVLTRLKSRILTRN